MGLWPAASILPSPLMLSAFSGPGQGAMLMAVSAPAPASTVLGASVALFHPLVLTDPIVIVKGWVMNGATINGNWDVGVYDQAFNKIASTGSQAQSGANALQEATLSVTLDVGRYHLAFALDSATAAYLVAATAFSLLGGSNYTTSSPFPLPATFTPTGTISGTVLFGLSARSLVV